MNKVIISVAAIALIVCCAVGGTLAWLTATTAPVVNTFTYGDIDITLAETTTDYKMVPGNKIAKDPKVTVEASSEDCWLFVKIEKNSAYDTYLADYTVATGWTQLMNGTTPVTGVYYREAEAGDAFYVLAGEGTGTLKNGYVTVKDSVTKAQMEALKVTSATAPTLTFTAYAVQKDNVATALDAWKIIDPTT